MTSPISNQPHIPQEGKIENVEPIERRQTRFAEGTKPEEPNAAELPRQMTTSAPKNDMRDARLSANTFTSRFIHNFKHATFTFFTAYVDHIKPEDPKKVTVKDVAIVGALIAAAPLALAAGTFSVVGNTLGNLVDSTIVGLTNTFATDPAKKGSGLQELTEVKPKRGRRATLEADLGAQVEAAQKATQLNQTLKRI